MGMKHEEILEHENNLSELKIIKCYLSDMKCENLAIALNWIMLDYRSLLEEYVEIKYQKGVVEDKKKL